MISAVTGRPITSVSPLPSKKSIALGPTAHESKSFSLFWSSRMLVIGDCNIANAYAKVPSSSNVYLHFSFASLEYAACV